MQSAAVAILSSRLTNTIGLAKHFYSTAAAGRAQGGTRTQRYRPDCIAQDHHHHHHLKNKRVGFSPPKARTMSALEEDGSSTMAYMALKDKLAAGGRGGGRRGGRGGGRGGRAAGGGAQDRDVQVSRALSKLLRHQALNAGITLDEEGYAPLDKVLAWGPLRSLKVTLADVQSVVATNEKQRFSLKPKPETASSSSSSAAQDQPSNYLIRANQGHTIKLDSSSLLEPITVAAGNVPPRVLHGTYFAFWPAIVASGGLKPMGRNHVHCSAGTPEDDGVVSGMRRDAELLIEVDVEGSLREGVHWWRSENGVLLTEGGEDGVLSARFFKKVTGRRIDVGVLWEDGEEKASLPAGIKARTPQGKGPRGGGGRGGRGRQ